MNLNQLAPALLWCAQCNSERPLDICHKCGSETFIPAVEWKPLKLPPIERIRELAREVGYAIGVHGTLERDLDLIAAPWTDDAVDCQSLIEHIAKGIDAKVIDSSEKPFGRFAVNLQLNGWFKLIDLSICPKTEGR